MTNWGGPPAIGTVLARLTSLAARLERLRIEKQRQSLVRVLALASKKDAR